MFFASEKEYEQLKKETAEVKDCITKYIGYIISIAGISPFFAKFIDGENFRTEDQVCLIMLSLIVIMIIITMLFEVIWYKFKSHNRYIGYLTLMSQETAHYKIEENDLQNKSYLDDPQGRIIKEDDLPQKNIFSWEFIMSRFHSANFKNESKGLLFNSTNKSKFRFTIPQNYKYIILDSENENSFPEYKSLDFMFFSKIVHPIYETKGLTRKEKLLYPFFWAYRVFRALFKPFVNSKYYYDVKDFPVDIKYMAGGWTYPIKVTQIAITSIFILFIGANWVFFHTNQYKFEINLSTPETVIDFILLVSSYFILTIWLNRYLLGLKKFLQGKYSIGFYCWTFFVFRVQLLNSYGIIPNYFSRSFIRFFKTQIILNFLPKISTSEEKKCDCSICNTKQTDCYRFQLVDKKNVLICNHCIDNYKEKLQTHKRFLPMEEKVHEKLKFTIKIQAEQASKK